MTKTLSPSETTKTAVDYDSVIEAANDTGNFKIEDIQEILDWHAAAGSGSIVSVRGWKRGHFRVEFANGDFAYFFTTSVATWSNTDVAEALEADTAPADWHKGEFVSSPKRSTKETQVASKLCSCGYHNAVAVDECELCGAAL